MSTEKPEQPLLRVVNGNPTDIELAALVAVVGARAARGADTGATLRSRWGHPESAVRRPVSTGPDGWRRGTLPH